MLPLDGSEISELAVEEAISQAKAFNLPVHLIRVVDTQVLEQVSGSASAFNYTMLGELFEEESRDAHSYLEQLATRIEEEGISVTWQVRVGPVARTIAEQIIDGDLVVMGSHGRSGLKRWVLGSVAEDVLRHASVPVLMVKQPQPTT